MIQNRPDIERQEAPQQPMQREQASSQNAPTRETRDKKQKLFDHILAKAMKAIYREDVIKQAVKVISKNPTKGLATSVKSLLDKLRVSAKDSGVGIPGEMLPALTLEIMSQLAELTSNKTDVKISGDHVISAFEKIASEEYQAAIKNGEISKEELAQSMEQLKAQYGGDTGSERPSDGQVSQGQGNMQAQEMSSNTEANGGLL